MPAEQLGDAHSVCEALGMTMPGAAPVRANSDKMFAQAEAAGHRIVDMVWEELRPRDILTEAAFHNAVRIVFALSGSINCIKHVEAFATEAQSGVDVRRLYEDLMDDTPVLCAVRPSGPPSIEELEEGGGARAVLKRLGDKVRGDAMTVTGKTLAEVLDGWKPSNDTVKTVANPVSDKPAIVLIRGSLAPEDAIVKLGLRYDRKMKVTGPAVIYEDINRAIEGLKAGEVKPGYVLKLCGLGVRGAPGMGMASRIVFAIEGTGMGETVSVVTDGQLSSLVNKGLVVGEVSPEAWGKTPPPFAAETGGWLAYA